MNTRGQVVAHVIWAIVVVLCCFGILGMWYWIYTMNRPDVYQTGATHIEEHQTNWPLAIHIGEGGCAHLGKDGKPDLVKKVSINGVMK